MSVKVIRNLRVSGVDYAEGQILTFDTTTEADWIGHGWVVPTKPEEQSFPVNGRVSQGGVLRKLEVSGIGIYVPYILAQSAVPTILLSSATAITATGAISGLTALPYTPSGVVRVYCFAQAGLAAGLYYARFSSLTSCQLYTDAAGTVTPTGITAGAYTGGTGLAVLTSITVPGGALGPNGRVRIEGELAGAATTNAKTARCIFAGIPISVHQFSSSSVTASRFSGRVTNRGSSALNYYVQTFLANQADGIAGLTAAQLTVDTANEQGIAITGQLSVATDFIILEAISIEILPGA